MRYRRADAAGGTYFFTVNLADRQSGLLVRRWEDSDGYGERSDVGLHKFSPTYALYVRGAEMIFVPRDASDEQVLDIAHHWIDVLAREDYAATFAALGYALLYQYDCPGPECIRSTIKRYRSPEFYPGIEEFTVTNWRTATGGNPTPLQKITWFKPNDIGLRGALEMHLPLNGKWSDLEADFVWFENKNLGEGFHFSLEEISSPAQQQREYENAP